MGFKVLYLPASQLAHSVHSFVHNRVNIICCVML